MAPRPTLRGQLLRRLAVVLCALLLLLGLFQFITLQGYLRRRTAENLRTQVRTAWSSLVAASANPSPAELVAALASRQTQVTVLGPDGSVLLSRGGPPGEHPGLDAVRAGDYALATDRKGTRWLVVREPLAVGRARGEGTRPAGGRPVASVLLATPVSDLNATLLTLALLTALGGALGLALALLASGRLIDGAVRPLGHLAGAATAIAGGDWERRAPTEGSQEVAQVATAFNHMLDRIQAAFDNERRSQEQMRRFLADAAHELRTPITALNGFVEVLQAGAAENRDELQSALATMQGEGQRLARLVQSLLQLARLDAQPDLPRTALDLCALLRELQPALQMAARDHQISLAAAGPATVRGNADALSQVVWNLVDNARLHSPAGSSIRITCQGESGAVGHSEPEAVLLSVADAGADIPPEDLPHVFERFYRGDPSRTRRTGGSGLGLAIVQSIAHAHGGTVSIAGAPGAGTTVTLRLPAARA